MSHDHASHEIRIKEEIVKLEWQHTTILQSFVSREKHGVIVGRRGVHKDDDDAVDEYGEDRRSSNCPKRCPPPRRHPSITRRTAEVTGPHNAIRPPLFFSCSVSFNMAPVDALCT